MLKTNLPTRCKLLPLALLLVPALAHADTLPCVSSEPLATLLAPEFPGCTIGDKLFSNFSANSVGTLTGIDASQVNVLTAISPTGEFLLTFAGGLSAFGGLDGGLLDQVIGYNVSTLSGAALINDLVLSVGSLETFGEGPNSASVDEFACIGLNVSCSSSSADFHLSAGPNESQLITFSPVAGLSVTKEIKINVAAVNLVTLESVTNGVSQVGGVGPIPEPGTLVLLGSAVLTLALTARRRLAG